MRILVLSDLHHEMWKLPPPMPDLGVSRPDVVVLAGDINSGAKAITWAASFFAGLPVLYVHGNHEAYGKTLEEVQADIAQACVASGSVHFLDCAEFVIGSGQTGVRFLGATLWTDFRLFGADTRLVCMHQAQTVMSDYKRIRLAKPGYRKLRATDTAQFHAQHRSWLQEKLAQSFAGRTVVVTHMAPSMQSVPDEYTTDPVSAAYASRLEALAERADLWIHGHTHSSFDYNLGPCRVICNPCGYPHRDGSPENADFDPNFVVEV
jgi:predicted phosphodiesterase